MPDKTPPRQNETKLSPMNQAGNTKDAHTVVQRNTESPKQLAAGHHRVERYGLDEPRTRGPAWADRSSTGRGRAREHRGARQCRAWRRWPPTKPHEDTPLNGSKDTLG